MKSNMRFTRHGGIPPNISSFGTGVGRISNIKPKKTFQDFQYVDELRSPLDVHHLLTLSRERSSTLFLIGSLSNCVKRTYLDLKSSNMRLVSQFTGMEAESPRGLVDFIFKKYGAEPFLWGSFSLWESARLQKICERSLRKKSKLDDWFYQVPYGVSMIHRVALDKRPGKLIVGMDFNAMFPSCLDEKNYPVPAMLKQDSGAHLKQEILDKEIVGAFNCVIRNPNKFMQDFMMHAMSYGSFQCPVVLDEEFSMILHANEVIFWQRHAEIEVIDGVFSRQSIKHPLHKLAHKLYETRMQSSGIEKAIIKQEMVLMHSSTSISSKRTISKEVATEEYGFDDSLIDDFIPGIPTIQQANNIYCLQRQVLANARIKLLSTIERIVHHEPEAVICYANVDSLHLSVDAGKLDQIKALLDIGLEMGQLKIEFIGDAGLWLDPGRYWISKDNKVVAFRSGSERIKPKIHQMSLHHRFLKVSREMVLVKHPEYLEDAIDMMANLAELTSKNMKLARGLYASFKKVH